MLLLLVVAIGFSGAASATVVSDKYQCPYCSYHTNSQSAMQSHLESCHQAKVVVIQGEQGPKGDKGDTGAVGPAGPQGPQGIQGIQGVAGAVGAAGKDAVVDYNKIDAYIDARFAILQKQINDQFDAFAESINYYASSQWEYIFSHAVKGDKGDTGATGATGAQGEQGIQGVKGDTGAQGPQGEVGPMGPQGIQGIQGLTGEQGIQGLTGDTGAIGPKGDTGAAGQNGADGLNGLNGINGTNGHDGITKIVTVYKEAAQKASVNTIPMQHTGSNTNYLIGGLLAVLAGLGIGVLIDRRRK